MNNEIHFFDLDNTLWNIEGKIWLISKNAPNKPLIKLSKEDFTLIKAGIFKSDNILISYNDENYWISEQLLERVQKIKKVEIEDLGFSFRELFDENYIDKIKFLLKNIIDLNNKKVEIGILSGRHNQEGEKEFLNGLRKQLNDLHLDINKIYYVGERFNYDIRDNISFEKMRLILEHLVGVKIEKNKFIPLKQDWYKKIYFYDSEIQTIYTMNTIQKYFNELIRNSDDETFNLIKEKINENELTLTTNYISNNLLNKFKTTKIILKEPEKYAIKLEKLEIKKFNKF